MSASNIPALRAPIAIGGVGGSGTRVIANIIQNAGVYIGDDLNDALDNLWFPLLFTHPSVLDTTNAEFNQRASIFKAAMAGGYKFTESDISLVNKLSTEVSGQHSAHWLDGRARSLIASLGMSNHHAAWGWKAPNTHIVIDRLAHYIDGLKYIHIARNGLDMAYSKNQNQLNIWGKRILGEDCAITPRNSLSFWRWAHERILRIGTDMGSRFLFLKFEDICISPETEIQKILTFIGIEPQEGFTSRAASLIKPPKSIGRHKNQPLDVFVPEDVAFVRRLGFEVGE